MGGTAPTAVEVRTLLDYDPATGIFTWRVKPNRRIAAGDRAGYTRKTDGYTIIHIGGSNYLAQRLAWLHVKGEWPATEIDHRNTVRSDNRWDNLREAADFPNQQNIRKATKRSTTGVLGVSASGRGYRATVRLDRKNHYSTTYPTIEEAAAEYVSMKRQLHPGCTL